MSLTLKVSEGGVDAEATAHLTPSQYTNILEDAPRCRTIIASLAKAIIDKIEEETSHD